MSATSRRLRRAMEKRAALEAAWLEGCRCAPTIRHGHRGLDGVGHLHLGHDTGCPMVDAPDGLLLVVYGRGCEGRWAR